MQSYFEKAGGRFLRFDIEADAPERIREFLAHEFDIDVSAWRAENRTIKRDAWKRMRLRLAAPSRGDQAA